MRKEAKQSGFQEYKQEIKISRKKEEKIEETTYKMQ